MVDSNEPKSILQRLQQLEAQNQIRNCLNRYMEICDELNQNTNLEALMDLFDRECIWEGVGKKYAQSFGRLESWQAVYDMFKTYTLKDSHFVMNAHFVNSEQIYIEGDVAVGHWLMLQTSTFKTGASHLNAAKLTIRFKQQNNGIWKIKHFQTENIFSRPVTHWTSDDELPVPQSNLVG